MTPGKDLLRRLDLHALRCLCVLVQESHVSRAAAQLGISQPTMSATLAHLREVFGDPLLVRTARGMAPTRHALRIAANARAALELLDASFALTRDFEPASAETTFRVSATESVGLMLTPPLVQALETAAPHVRLAMCPSEPARLREQLEEGEVDLVVGFLPHAPDALYATTLYEQALRVMVARDHPRIQGRLSAAQYMDERHVHFRPQHGHSTIERQVDEAFAAQGRTRRVGVVVASALASAPIVAASGHLATVTQAVAELGARAHALQVLAPPLELAPVRVSMFWHERTHASPAHAWLRRVIREQFLPA